MPETFQAFHVVASQALGFETIKEVAAHAACTRVRFSQRLPGVMRRRRRFPALSSLPEHIPAHEAKC